MGLGGESYHRGSFGEESSPPSQQGRGAGEFEAIGRSKFAREAARRAAESQEAAE